ncbi:hypothetical protein B0I29_11370 [Actinoplanes lutulentus]|uniref:Uncharacterized protein n=1 Tax=Actinoplanes lutulentus TaxID=1287878 RepID=A0A327Z7P1_9ACTN|nr:hypothetical protein [Actinoplanes lutulentus]RAK32775.1 hypothetical protein B0I29_11370 [Actinoplanes lutulentus]
MLTHFERPQTRRYRAELVLPSPPHRFGNALLATAFLLCAVLVGVVAIALT